MQLQRLGQLVLGEVEITVEQGGLTAQRGGEGDRPQHPRALGGGPQVGRQLEDLLVRGRAVEQVLRDAQVRVEDPDGQLGPRPAAPQLDAQSLGPFAAGVRDQTLQRDEVEQPPVSAGPEPTRASDAAASAGLEVPRNSARLPRASSSRRPSLPSSSARPAPPRRSPGHRRTPRPGPAGRAAGTAPGVGLAARASR